MTEGGWTEKSYKLEREICKRNKYQLCINSFAAHFISLLFVGIIRAHQRLVYLLNFTVREIWIIKWGVCTCLTRDASEDCDQWHKTQLEARQQGCIPGGWYCSIYSLMTLMGGSVHPQQVCGSYKRATEMIKGLEHVSSERGWESWDWSSQERQGSGWSTKMYKYLMGENKAAARLF